MATLVEEGIKYLPPLRMSVRWFGLDYKMQRARWRLKPVISLTFLRRWREAWSVATDGRTDGRRACKREKKEKERRERSDAVGRKSSSLQKTNKGLKELNASS